MKFWLAKLCYAPALPELQQRLAALNALLAEAKTGQFKTALPEQQRAVQERLQWTVTELAARLQQSQ